MKPVLSVRAKVKQWLGKNGEKALCLCPFHEEKTPSMLVQVHEGTYHCLGCGQKGAVDVEYTTPDERKVDPFYLRFYA